MNNRNESKVALYLTKKVKMSSKITFSISSAWLSLVLHWEVEGMAASYVGGGSVDSLTAVFFVLPDLSG